jgi:hypothetical protein
VTLFREVAVFAPTIEAAADRLGISAAAVTKDYWVSEVLRVLARDFPEDFIFKGGTSMSKCYRIIERFSEDVDVLILPGDRSKNATHTLMKDMAESAADALSTNPQSVSSETGVHKSVRLTYPAGREPSLGISAGVLLEMGRRGGPNPHETLPAGSLLRDALAANGQNLGSYDDLRPFLVPVLHPGRTLLEKLCVIHSNLGSNPNMASCHKHARHYYDVYQLLGDERVLRLLRNKPVGQEIMLSMTEVTDQYFGGGEVRPEGGWSASPAFEAGSQMLSSAYDATMTDLYFGADEHPTFAAVCSRTAELHDLL